MKKNAKRLLSLLLVCLMIVSIASCNGKTDGGAATTPTPDSGSSTPDNTTDDPGTSSGGDPDRVLNIASMQDSGTLYPLGVTGGFINVLYAFYEPLYDHTADGERVWMLATGLDRVSDLQYTLTIREGVTFSNGNPLTAEDVMFSMEQCAANPQFALNVKVVDFEKTKVTGEYTIDLWYTEFNASQEPGFASMFVMDKESFDEVALSRSPIGTGPYTIAEGDEYVVNSHLTATARDDYWGGEVKIKNIEFKVINETSQIINALETGIIDIAPALSISDADYVESLGYEVRIANAGYNYVTMFSMLPGTPLESKEARWAISHAIDREAINDIIYEGRSSVTDYPTSHTMIDFEDRFLNMHDTYSIGYDPALAETYADQAGLKDKEIRIITNGSTDANTIAEMVQGDLLNIGVNAKIVNYDQATYFGILMDATNFEIAIFTPSAPSMLAVDVLAMYLTFIPLGWEGDARDLYGQLSMGAISTADETERGQKLYDALEVFVDYDPWFGLVELISARAISKDLKGVEYMIAGITYFHNMEFVN